MKVLVIGLGSIAQKHINALREIDSSIEIFALRSSSDAVAVPRVNNIFKVEECPLDVSFVIVSTPTFKHIQTIKEVITLGCPLFIEKPIYHLLNEEVLALQKELNKANITTYIGCNLRHHSLLKQFKALLDERILNGQKVNEVNAYCGTYLPDWRKNSDYKDSYSASSKLGGGVDLDVIHELDYLTWFFGTPLKTTAQKSSASHLNIDSIDGAYYWLNYEGFQVNLSLNYFRRVPKRTVEIVLNKDIITLDLINSTITLNNGVIVIGEQDEVLKSYTHQMTSFINTIQSDGTFENDFDNGLETLKVCLANVEG